MTKDVAKANKVVGPDSKKSTEKSSKSNKKLGDSTSKLTKDYAALEKAVSKSYQNIEKQARKSADSIQRSHQRIAKAQAGRGIAGPNNLGGGGIGPVGAASLGSIAGFSGRLGAVGVGGIGVAGIATHIISSTASLEMMMARLETFQGGAAAAADEFERIKSTARETPFAIDDILNATLRFKALGLDPTEKTMQSI